MTDDKHGNRVKSPRAPPDVEEEVLSRLPWWKRELLAIWEKVKRDAETEKVKAEGGL